MLNTRQTISREKTFAEIGQKAVLPEALIVPALDTLSRRTARGDDFEIAEPSVDSLNIALSGWHIILQSASRYHSQWKRRQCWLTSSAWGATSSRGQAVTRMLGSSLGRLPTCSVATVLTRGWVDLDVGLTLLRGRDTGLPGASKLWLSGLDGPLLVGRFSLLASTLSHTPNETIFRSRLHEARATHSSLSWCRRSSAHFQAPSFENNRSLPA